MGNFKEFFKGKNKKNNTINKNEVTGRKIERNELGQLDYIIKNTDYFNGNIHLLKAGLKIVTTPEMENEFIKCKKDIIYFCRNYLRVDTLDHGRVFFNPYIFQEKMLLGYCKPGRKRHVAMICRQAGKTVTSVAYIVWRLLFFESQKVCATSYSDVTASDYFYKVKAAIEDLPYWLQYMGLDGTVRCNEEKGMLFGGGNAFIAGSAGSKKIRSKSFNQLIIDEVAFIEDWETFSSNIMPTTSTATDYNIILMSTPLGTEDFNGGHFYQLWNEAKNNTSDATSFFAYTVHWQSVPRNVKPEIFKKEKINELGLDKWEREFELKFDKSASGIKLIDSQTLEKLRHKKPVCDVNGLTIYEDVNKYDSYLALVDTSQGTGGDYAVINVFNVTPILQNKSAKQVAVWRKNKFDYNMLWKPIMEVCNHYHCYAVIEKHGIGIGIIKDVENNANDVLIWELDGPICFEPTPVNKAIAISGLKTLLESGHIQVVDKTTISELFNFIRHRTKVDSWHGGGKHNDDTVTTLYMLAYFMKKDDCELFTTYDIIRKVTKDAHESGRIIFDNTIPKAEEKKEKPKMIGEMTNIETYNPDVKVTQQDMEENDLLDIFTDMDLRDEDKDVAMIDQAWDNYKDLNLQNIRNSNLLSKFGRNLFGI